MNRAATFGIFAAVVAALVVAFVVRDHADEMRVRPRPAAPEVIAPRLPLAASPRPPAPIVMPDGVRAASLVPSPPATADAAPASSAVPWPPELVPAAEPLGQVEQRTLRGGVRWAAFTWSGKAPAEVAAWYRERLAERGWKLATESTAKVQLEALAQMGLAFRRSGEALVVARRRGQMAAIVLVPAGSPESTRVEVTAEGLRSR